MNKKTAAQLVKLQLLLSANNKALVTSTLIAFIFAYMQRAVIDSTVIYTWLSLVILVALARSALAISFKRNPADDYLTTLSRLTKFRTGVLIAGIVYGSAGFLMYPSNDPQYQMFLIFMLAGMSAGAVVSYSADIISATAYSVTVLIPIIIRLFLAGDNLSYAMGLAAIIYLSFMLMSVLHIYRSQSENIFLHLEASEHEETVRTSEERYRLLLTHLPIGIFHYDKNLVITYCNECFAKILNSSVENLVGLDMHTIKDKSVLLALDKTLAGEFGFYEDYYNATFSNAKKWIDLTCAPILNQNGKIDGGIAIIQDITTRKLAEASFNSIAEQLNDTLSAIPDILFELGLDGQYYSVHTPNEDLLVMPSTELIGKKVPQVLPPEASNIIMAALHEAHEQGSSQGKQYQRQSPQGALWFELSVARKSSPDENPRFVVLSRDISERKITERDLRISAIAFEAQESMMVSDANKVILRVNKAFTEVTGYTAEEVVGQTSLPLRSNMHDTNFYQSIWSSVNSKGAWKGEIYSRKKNGEIYPGILSISAVYDINNVVTHYVSTLVDITKEKITAEEIQFLAFYDPLTGLPNRRLLMDRLSHALMTNVRKDKDGALLFIDLDHFKTLNDTLGHDVGDLLLQQVAKRLTTCVREGDTVARLGGDEYVVLLENLSEQAIEAATQAEAISTKILSALNEPYQLDSHEYHNTSSIGVALFSNHGQSQEDLLKHADIAMYQSKKAGRNTLRFFDPAMQQAIHVRADMERELRRAIEQQQFQLHYQVQTDHKGNAIGAEALIRWFHPERGLIPPLQFIPMTEETGLISSIGEWVIDTACAQLHTWQHIEPIRDISIAINISAKQFHQADFSEKVLATIERYDINPMLLKLELTESILLEDFEGTIATINTLKKIGVMFSLDDFGTGYSSLQYLKCLPLQQLKIDQSFVRDILTDSSDQAIVRTIIAMAHSLELEVIAEGVETEAQRQYLLEIGCKSFQGYLFGKPMPITEFEATLPED